MTELRFDDRVAIVTGAGRGVGRSYALLLAERGARVVVADNGAAIDGAGSSPDPADEVVAEIESLGGRAVSCCASVAEERGAEAIVATALDAYGRLDIVVNNAGIHDPGRFAELSVAQFRSMLDVHFFGALLVTRAAWPHLVAAGYGRVVNTVSDAMLGGITELCSYGAAKGAVYGLTRNLATEGMASGIRVNAIAPRAYTRMSASHAEKLSAELNLPLGAMDEINASMPPERCAPGVVFLAHESCPLNGEVLQVGMGAVARLAMVCTTGFAKVPLTAEDIAENLDSIMDLDQAWVPDSAGVRQ